MTPQVKEAMELIERWKVWRKSGGPMPPLVENDGLFAIADEVTRLTEALAVAEQIATDADTFRPLYEKAEEQAARFKAQWEHSARARLDDNQSAEAALADAKAHATKEHGIALRRAAEAEAALEKQIGMTKWIETEAFKERAGALQAEAALLAARAENERLRPLVVEWASEPCSYEPGNCEHCRATDALARAASSPAREETVDPYCAPGGLCPKCCPPAPAREERRQHCDVCDPGPCDHFSKLAAPAPRPCEGHFNGQGPCSECGLPR